MIYTSAPSNIALIKYWGKRDTKLNLPLSSSFSGTLEQMRSWVAIASQDKGDEQWMLYGDPQKAMRVLEAARKFTRNTQQLAISICNDFPSQAGLASSASSMAALAFGLDIALSRGNTPLAEIAKWARLGSGSAVRSLYPGFVLWQAGQTEDGSDCIAQSQCSAAHFPLDVLVCVIDDRNKPIGSSAAMEHCRANSPLYERFHARNADDLCHAMRAVQDRDFSALTEISEANCLAMHAVMQSAKPPINYFMAGTHQTIAAVRELRKQGISCFFSIDAGPNVKIFCPPEHTSQIIGHIHSISGVMRVIHDRISNQAARRETHWPRHLPCPLKSDHTP